MPTRAELTTARDAAEAEYQTASTAEATAHAAVNAADAAVSIKTDLVNAAIATVRASGAGACSSGVGQGVPPPRSTRRRGCS